MEQDLIDIGLSKNEAKIYIALTEIGESTIGDIAKKSQIHRTNVYDAMENLVRKGLVSFILKDKIKYYQPADASNLFNMIQEKEEKVKSLLPRLNMLQGLSHDRSEASIQEGLAASRRALDGFLKYKSDILVMGAPSNVGQLIGPFLSNFHKRRVGMKIVMKHLSNTDGYDRIKFLKTLKYTEVKVLPSQYNSPVTTFIVGDEVTLIRFTENPIIITIKNLSIAEGYRKYFYYMWKDAKPA
jgi:sugar-specific transcriptional regulator TrmB